MRLCTIGILFGCMLSFVFFQDAYAADPSVFPYDPVELSKAREIAGMKEHEILQDGYLYRFVSASNEAIFRNAPAEFQIQLGGACARMGSLSGQGSVDIFGRHEGKLYIFASEACRSTFLKSPELLLMTDDERLMPSAEELAAGKTAVQKFLDSVAKETRRQTVHSIRQTMESAVDSDNRSYNHRVDFTYVADGKMRRDEWWDSSKYSRCQTRDAAWFSDTSLDGLSKQRAMVPVQRQEMRNDMWQQYAGLFQLLQQPDVIVQSIGTENIGETECQVVNLYADGIQRTVWLESSTGRILRHVCKGRAPSLAVARLQIDYSDFQTVNGLTLATTATKRRIDKDNSPSEPAVWAFHVDEALDPKMFVVPATL